MASRSTSRSRPSAAMATRPERRRSSAPSARRSIGPAVRSSRSATSCRKREAAAGLVTTALKRTPLYHEHVAAGARVVPFGGGGVALEDIRVIEEHPVGPGAGRGLHLRPNGGLAGEGARGLSPRQR